MIQFYNQFMNEMVFQIEQSLHVERKWQPPPVCRQPQHIQSIPALIITPFIWPTTISVPIIHNDGSCSPLLHTLGTFGMARHSLRHRWLHFIRSECIHSWCGAVSHSSTPTHTHTITNRTRGDTITTADSAVESKISEKKLLLDKHFTNSLKEDCRMGNTPLGDKKTYVSNTHALVRQQR